MNETDNHGRTGFGTGHLFFAFLGGAAAGAATALLLAPTSGAQTRQRIGRTARRGRESVAALPPALRTAYTEASRAAQEAFTQVYNERTGADGS